MENVKENQKTSYYPDEVFISWMEQTFRCKSGSFRGAILTTVLMTLMIAVAGWMAFDDGQWVHNRFAFIATLITLTVAVYFRWKTPLKMNERGKINEFEQANRHRGVLYILKESWLAPYHWGALLMAILGLLPIGGRFYLGKPTWLDVLTTFVLTVFLLVYGLYKLKKKIVR